MTYFTCHKHYKSCVITREGHSTCNGQLQNEMGHRRSTQHRAILVQAQPEVTVDIANDSSHPASAEEGLLGAAAGD